MSDENDDLEEKLGNAVRLVAQMLNYLEKQGLGDSKEFKRFEAEAETILMGEPPQQTH